MSIGKQFKLLGMLVLMGCGSPSDKGNKTENVPIDTKQVQGNKEANTPAAAPDPTVTARSIEISLTEDGFVPSPVTVKEGELVNLVVTRKTDRTCAKEIVIRDLNVKKRLPLNTPVTIELTPTAAGSINYSCAMGMYKGVITVE